MVNLRTFNECLPIVHMSQIVNHFEGRRISTSVKDIISKLYSSFREPASEAAKDHQAGSTQSQVIIHMCQSMLIHHPQSLKN